MAKAHGTVAAPPTTANGVDAAAPAAAAVEPATPQLLSAVAGDGGEDGSESGGRASPAAAAAAPAASLLPGMPSVPAPQITGADLSRGVATAFPGYADLRLLAPNAELRLLQAGVSAMVNPHNLRCVWVGSFGCSWRAVPWPSLRQHPYSIYSLIHRPTNQPARTHPSTTTGHVGT